MEILKFMALTFRSKPEVGILLNKIMDEYLPFYLIYTKTFVGLEMMRFYDLKFNRKIRSLQLWTGKDMVPSQF